jgi:peptidyl-prolyl cis-trans isomerase A (cyclophilin A)
MGIAAGLQIWAALAVAAQVPPAQPQEPTSAAPAPAAAPAGPPLPRVALTTGAGRIVIEVDTVHAPISGNNFLRYVDRRLLDGTTFYRRLKVQDHFGFIQFGANGAPGKFLPPIKHEPTTVTGIKHTDFTVSTARLAPGTARWRR